MNALTTTRAGSSSLAPQNFSEALEFSRMLAKSGMVPKDYVGKPENIMVALQWGAEVGLGPLQAIQNIAVINGRPSLWGDAALALVRAHPACQSVREGVEGEGEARHGWCEVQRKGEQPQRRTFSMADAKKAGLAGKAGPWTQYPDRMLQLRARGFAIRDVFPDALRGVITVEEAQDIPADPLPPARGETITSTAERVAVPNVELIVVAPDGTQRDAPKIEQWVRWSLAAIGKVETGAALARWQDAMEAHLEAVARHYPGEAQQIREAAAERLDALANSWDDQQEPAA